MLSSALLLEAQSVNADYDRNSLTVIQITHSDAYDATLSDYLSRTAPGGNRYDATPLPVRVFPAQKARYAYNPDGGFGQAEAYQTSLIPFVFSQLSDRAIARLLVGAWFDRNANGDMDLRLINARAEYNATDQTYNIAHSQALGQYLLQGDGLNLLDHSYVLVVDHGVPTKSYTTHSRTGEQTGVTWSAQAFGYLYKLVFGPEDRQHVYDCWMYDDDDAATRERKRQQWHRLTFTLQRVKAFTTSNAVSKTFTASDRSEDGLLEACITGVPAALIRRLEQDLPEWQVKSSIYKTQPIRVKIGTKEGMKALDRYEVLEYVLGVDQKMSTRRLGYIRAVDVADNERVSTGHSLASSFYQVAGYHLEPGMLVREKRSKNFDVKLFYFGGSAPAYGGEWDFFTHMTQRGSTGHARMGLSFFPYTAAALVSADYPSPEKMQSFNVRLGYGYGVRPFRQLEFIPGIYVLMNDLNKASEDASAKDMMAWCAEAGLDANLNLFYPVKLNVGAFYNVPVLTSPLWRENNKILEAAGLTATGFFWRAGLVYEF